MGILNGGWARTGTAGAGEIAVAPRVKNPGMTGDIDYVRGAVFLNDGRPVKIWRGFMGDGR